MSRFFRRSVEDILSRGNHPSNAEIQSSAITTSVLSIAREPAAKYEYPISNVANIGNIIPPVSHIEPLDLTSYASEEPTFQRQNTFNKSKVLHLNESSLAASLLPNADYRNSIVIKRRRISENVCENSANMILIKKRPLPEVSDPPQMVKKLRTRPSSKSQRISQNLTSLTSEELKNVNLAEKEKIEQSVADYEILCEKASQGVSPGVPIEMASIIESSKFEAILSHNQKNYAQIMPSTVNFQRANYQILFCDDCPRIRLFRSTSELYAHYDLKHPRKKLFQCSKCPIRLRSHSDLLMHFYTGHSDSNVYKCLMCPLAEFASVNDFLAHEQRTHSRR